MARFTAIPAVPQGGITDWQSVLISSVKENVELLTGLRGESDLISQEVAGLDYYGKLITDVQTLANDLAFTRAVLNALLRQLKGVG